MRSVVNGLVRPPLLTSSGYQQLEPQTSFFGKRSASFFGKETGSFFRKTDRA